LTLKWQLLYTALILSIVTRWLVEVPSKMVGLSGVAGAEQRARR
jgi:hypothetical protein